MRRFDCPGQAARLLAIGDPTQALIHSINALQGRRPELEYAPG